MVGTVDPLKLAKHLAADANGNRSLQEVRIYRGRPDNAKDSRSYSAWRSQTAAWKRAGGALVVERYRDLKYRGAEVMEKGIDVWLAIDLIYLAMDQGADHVVVFSTDTDVLPAIELAKKIRGAAFVEVAGWDGPVPRRRCWMLLTSRSIASRGSTTTACTMRRTTTSAFAYARSLIGMRRFRPRGDGGSPDPTRRLQSRPARAARRIRRLGKGRTRQAPAEVSGGRYARWSASARCCRASGRPTSCAPWGGRITKGIVRYAAADPRVCEHRTQPSPDPAEP